jgi:WD40 repeat protein
LTEGIDARHAIFAAPNLLITVSTDSVLTSWRLQIKNQGVRRGDVQLTREATLRGHTSRITCLAASASWSLLVSGTEVSAIIWIEARLTKVGRECDGLGYESIEVYSDFTDYSVGSNQVLSSTRSGCKS